MFDLIIIGGGPAGMTAGVYAARKMLKTLIITENIGGQVSLNSDIENYPGYQYISGSELVEKFKNHMEKFNIEKELSQVISITAVNGRFIVSTTEGKAHEAKAIIIATGRARRKLNIPGEDEFLGRGVSYCVTCDGPLFKGKDVAVVGDDDSAFRAVLQLSKIANTVNLISGGFRKGDKVIQDKVKNLQNVKFYINYKPLEIKGENVVSGLIVQSKDSKEILEIPVSGVFIEIGSVPVSVFAKNLVEINERGGIKTNCKCETSTPGIYAAGDVTDAIEKQIVIAAGDGAKAVLNAYRYLSALPD